ncbi:MAG: hypothetical protein PHV85_09505, partial [Desulfovibrionaceae bacterium]|nr:hypothetical protein [Desulfovibrionaceae bacterium]
MTIASQTSKVSYLGNGSTRVFSIPFYFVKNSDLAVVLRRSDGGEIRLTETSDYVLSGVKDPLGGSLETSIAPAQDEVLAVFRDPGIVQETDYQENDAFPAETHEAALDLLTMICQGLDEKLARAVKLKVTSPASGAELPDPEPGRVLGWDASGQGLENKTLAGAGVLETPVPVADGGTGASAADAALANLGLSGFMRGMAGDQDAIEVLDRLGVTSFARTLMDDQDAQEARQTLGVDQGADEVKNLLVAEAMRRAVGDAEDGREYLGDGWMDPLADADEV